MIRQLTESIENATESLRQILVIGRHAILEPLSRVVYERFPWQVSLHPLLLCTTLNLTQNSHVDPAGEAFKAAIPKLSSELTRDDRKKAAVQSVSSLEDLRSVVSTAEKRYTESHRPAQKWLVKFSQRVQYYGNVLDVIAQHHPEYVSLAWGAMKFLFTVRIVFAPLE